MVAKTLFFSVFLFLLHMCGLLIWLLLFLSFLKPSRQVCLYLLPCLPVHYRHATLDPIMIVFPYVQTTPITFPLSPSWLHFQSQHLLSSVTWSSFLSMSTNTWTQWRSHMGTGVQLPSPKLPSCPQTFIWIFLLHLRLMYSQNVTIVGTNQNFSRSLRSIVLYSLFIVMAL